MDIESVFPYSVHDEPSENWTIEELMQWCYLQSKQKTIHQIEDMKNHLEKQFIDGKKEIMEIHDKIMESQQAMEVNDNESNRKSLNSNNENLNPNQQTAKASQSKLSSSKPSYNAIHIEMISGPHSGEAFLLKPRSRQPCLIGRSAGKKFRERGVSLKKDPEVSTSHGKFEMKAGGKFYYTDTGSTNGSFVEGQDLGTNVALELKNGMEITFGGASLARITIVEA